MFVLISTCERECDAPRFFASYDEAFEVMKEELMETSRFDLCDEDEIEELMDDGEDIGLNEDSAYCENLN